MKLTKTWLSYIVWGLFSIVFFTNIGIAAIEIHQKNNMSDFLIPMVIMYGGTIAGIGIVFGVYKLIEKFVLSKSKQEGEQSVLSGPLEWFAFILVVFVAVSVRAIAIIASAGQLDGNGMYYSYGISGNAELLGNLYSNGSYLYGEFLRFVLGFLGHINTAAMAVQAGIQSITIVITYFMLKKALGRLPAWIGILLLSFLPGSFLSVRVCSPDALFTLFFVVYMLVLVFVCQANREQKIRVGAYGILYIVLGAFAAFLAYYDVAGLLAVVISVVAFSQYRNEDAWLKIQRAWLQILIFSLVFVFSFVLLLWFLPVNGQEVGPASLIGYLQSMIPNLNFNLMILTPHKGQWDSMALFIMAGLWFVGYLRTKEDKAFPYAFMIVVLTVTSFFGIGAYEYNAFASFLWIMLATIGISTLSIFRKTQKDVEKAEKIKEETKNRKEERERKRAEAAGEKSIRLDEVHKKPIQEPVFEPETERRTSSVYGAGAYNRTSASGVQNVPVNDGDAPKKSYGIGRKADAPAEQPKTVEIITHPTFSGNNSVNETTVETATVASSVAGRTVVRTVDKPPVASAPSPIPVESKPSYSQGSRSRRTLRSPSKSTFTPEDLERISRYTGMSYTTPTYQTQAPVSAEPVNTVMSDVENSNVNAGVQVDVPVATQPAATYIELPEAVMEVPATETPVTEVVTETVAETEPNPDVVLQTVETVQIGAETIVVGEENIETAEENVTEAKGEDIPAPSLPVVEFRPPARRHFRHPSKSTFSEEELEKISRYTGVDYKKNATVKEESGQQVAENAQNIEAAAGEKKETAVEKKAPAETVAKLAEAAGAKPVSGPVPLAKSGNASSGSTTVAKETDSLGDIKTQPERKPKLIRNPLAGPKPHVAKELNYDYTPKESEMKFDIVDLKGKDFFDI